jgi:membrane protease YdiL (CAAX protease family)
LGEVAGAYVIGLVASVIATSIVVGMGAGEMSIPVLVAGLAGEWLGFIGVPVVLSRLRGTGSLRVDFGASIRWRSDVIVGVVAGLGSSLIILGVLYPPFLWLLRQISGHKVSIGQSARNLGTEGRGAGFVVFAVLVALGAPLAEELFFRGFLQRSLQRMLGRVPGLGVAAVLFGLAHIGSTEAASLPALMLFGLVLGLLYQRTGRLGPGVVAHMAFNGLTVVSLILSR